MYPVLSRERAEGSMAKISCWFWMCTAWMPRSATHDADDQRPQLVRPEGEQADDPTMASRDPPVHPALEAAVGQPAAERSGQGARPRRAARTARSPPRCSGTARPTSRKARLVQITLKVAKARPPMADRSRSSGSVRMRWTTEPSSRA